jgi:hypothetical protein
MTLNNPQYRQVGGAAATVLGWARALQGSWSLMSTNSSMSRWRFTTSLLLLTCASVTPTLALPQINGAP